MTFHCIIYFHGTWWLTASRLLWKDTNKKPNTWEKEYKQIMLLSNILTTPILWVNCWSSEWNKFCLNPCFLLLATFLQFLFHQSFMGLCRDSKVFREYIFSSIVLISLFLFKPDVLQYYSIIRPSVLYAILEPLNWREKEINWFNIICIKGEFPFIRLLVGWIIRTPKIEYFTSKLFSPILFFFIFFISYYCLILQFYLPLKILKVAYVN